MIITFIGIWIVQSTTPSNGWLLGSSIALTFVHLVRWLEWPNNELSIIIGLSKIRIHHIVFIGKCKNFFIENRKQKNFQNWPDEHIILIKLLRAKCADDYYNRLHWCALGKCACSAIFFFGSHWINNHHDDIYAALCSVCSFSRIFLLLFFPFSIDSFIYSVVHSLIS